MKKIKNSMMKEVVLGSVITILLLVLGTYFTGKYAKEDTEKAVHSVSLFYLKELAGRREQVIANALSDFKKNLDVTIGTLETNNLESIQDLQAHLARMKQLYSVERVAFVDENGVIYTSRGTRTDIDLYPFNHTKLSEPIVSIKNAETSSKKVIVAMPMDRVKFQNTHLVVAFIEMDMTRMISAISLQTDNNNATFVNLYSADGQSLTNLVLGKILNEKNILKILEKAEFDADSSFDMMKEDFKEGHEGVQTFTYNGIRETMYYVPVSGTTWMLTYLVRESVISDRIDSIASGITERSLFQSLTTALVLLCVFGFVIYQTRTAAKAALEKEIADTENRVKQQELEEQLALQEELLQREKHRAEQERMITAMANDYKSVYYVDLDQDEATCYRKVWHIDGVAEEGEKFKFSERFKSYAIQFIDSAYIDGFMAFIRPENITGALADFPIVSYRYLAHRDGKDQYEMIKIAGVTGSKEAKTPTVLAVGFADCDEEMRTAMEKSETLAEALKTVEEASKAKTVFLSNMSHEIRTPMNAIIGLDTLALNDKNLPQSTRTYLEKIGSSAKHLLALINDILDMSRIESGRMTIRAEEFSFPKFLEQINTIIGGQCQEKGLKYDCRAIGDFADFYIGDEIKLRQALINLLGNAVKFTDKDGKVTFTAEKARSFEGKTVITFTVADTGIGISEEFLPKLFEAFSQENSSASNKYGSTGLGMAITKNIVDLMNGELTVKSKKNEGTTFNVTVTLLETNRKADKEEEAVAPENIRALVIDDDPIAREHASVVLSAAGIAADLAESGKEALQMVKMKIARRESYNLFIVDWQMPEMNGLECSRELKKLVNDDSAIIILTAYNWDDILHDAVSAGVDSFIAKPLFTQTLLDEFHKTLKKKHFNKKTEKNKADLTGRRILLAEDMLVNAEIMKEVLKMRDMVPDHAENGQIALEMFEKSEPFTYSAILMDMRMPVMTGLEATVAIRALDRPDAKKIPIIALTANAFDEDVEKSLQAGLNAHLAKPVDPEVLFKTLEEMIEE